MDGLSPSLVVLLETYLDSTDKLEIVWRVRSRGPMERVDLCDGLGVDGPAADVVIAALASAGLLECVDGTVLLGPRFELDTSVARLIDLYEHDRALVMSALSTLHLRRMRDEAAVVLAESHRLMRLN